MLDGSPHAETSRAAIARLRSRLDEALAPCLDGSPIALVDYPDHSNVGDSAIWLGETAFFGSHGLIPSYASTIGSHDDDALAAAAPEGTIFLHGGGNFGTLWPSHQDFRLHLLERFRGRPIVQLPQSIFFGDETSIAECARAIERHGRFTLFVRDRPSLEFAQRHFPCETVLAPDMAFAIGPLARHRPWTDRLYLLRTDVEKVQGSAARPDSDVSATVDWLEDDVRALRLTAIGSRLRTLLHRPDAGRVRIYDRRARSRLQRGIRTLSRGRVVVTDRLHGHILSTLLDIPHVALDNSYRKIGNFVDAWTQSLAILRLADGLDEADRQAATLLGASPAEPRT
ncbi:polysaccharide pyruvyl transferase family protein [Sphingosinicella sp. CPCC 101087]|uniref:polysaccharide pyruvyl transferase family protein n=1 Tax=Sphingosinicella sp. CPCC 101087 TaxID=2497754 RepID=UPI00101BCB2B|nr:polysaccharide pyruvyl transferase family protein [Sphingosinicella sp. CPCC 101087]